MNRAILSISLLVALTFETLGQESSAPRIWIHLADKPTISTGSQNELARSYNITERSLQRRAKVLPLNRLIDEHDLPVSQKYLEEIKFTGAKIIAVSRWLNAVSVEAGPEHLYRINRLPFVKATGPVASLSHPPVSLAPAVRQTVPKTTGVALNYGPSYTQLANIRVVDLHNLGIDGSGVLVGMIDDGFNNHRTHVALENIDVVAEYDFIHRIVSTQHQPWEGAASQGNHGAATLSALAGFEEGWLIGAAYGASLILAKTEMDSTEVPAEEDLYVEALEWMEQLGADVVSTSLGYVDWYPYDSLNGSTAITTKAARIAASKGVLLVTAMGNEGWYQTDGSGKPIPGLTGTMIAPADADTILAVGATYSDGEIAGFSSTGPTADGRVKPDIVTQGVSVVAANGGNTTGFISANGTSLATPLAAGVAALLLSAQPELTPHQVREAIINTARQIDDPFDSSKTSTYPNNYYGHGMVDAYSALLYHGPAVSSRPRVSQTDTTFTITVSAISNTSLTSDSVKLFYQTTPGGIFQQTQFQAGPQNTFMTTIARPITPGYPRGYVRVRDDSGRVRLAPWNAPESLFVFPDYTVVNTPVPTGFVLHQNYPNPFNAGTTVSFDAPGVEMVELHIFDLLGRRVRTVFQGPAITGPNSFFWDGTSDTGESVSTGLYIARLRFGDGVLSRKMLLLR